MSKLKLPLLAASVSLATAFTLSCSGDDGGDGSTSFTENYQVVRITSDYIVVKETYTDYECTETGLEEETETYDNRFDYSINNKVLTLDFYDNPVKFNGTTDTIIGTWTRNKNKAEHCREHYYQGEFDGYWCDEYYDATKLEVSASAVKLTRDVCPTDEARVGDDFEGNYIITSVPDCNNAIVSKGGSSIKIYVSESVMRFTYNGKSCEMKDAPKSERQQACNKAINECSGNSGYYCLEDAYYEYLEEPFFNCIKNNFPPDFLGDDGSAYKKLAKPLAKPHSKYSP